MWLLAKRQLQTGESCEKPSAGQGMECDQGATFHSGLILLLGLPLAKHQGNWKLGNLRAFHTQRGRPSCEPLALLSSPALAVTQGSSAPHSSRHASICLKCLWVCCQTCAGSKDFSLNWSPVFPGRTDEEAKQRVMCSGVEKGLGTTSHREGSKPSLVGGTWARGLLRGGDTQLALGSQMQSSE